MLFFPSTNILILSIQSLLKDGKVSDKAFSTLSTEEYDIKIKACHYQACGIPMLQYIITSVNNKVSNISTSTPMIPTVEKEPPSSLRASPKAKKRLILTSTSEENPTA